MAWEPHTATATGVILLGCKSYEFGCALVKLFAQNRNLFNQPIQGVETVVTILETISDIIKSAKLDLPWFQFALEIAVTCLGSANAGAKLAKEGFFKGGLKELSTEKIADGLSDTTHILKALKYATDATGLESASKALEIAIKVVDGAESEDVKKTIMAM